jgi:hypothetical protein
MAREQGAFRLHNPWPKIAWGMVALLVVVSTVLGFGVVSRYQQNGPTLDLWNAICRGLGLSADIAPRRNQYPLCARLLGSLGPAVRLTKLPPVIHSMAPSLP